MAVGEAADFFVVGGPVPPHRPCYVERAADRALARALHERRDCCVLGAFGTGKTSLMLRAARAVRRAGGLAVTVELARLEAAGRDHGAQDRDRAAPNRDGGAPNRDGGAPNRGRVEPLDSPADGMAAFARRVAQDLQIPADAGAWWRSRSNVPPPRRLADFFWEIVLTHTTAPITVFVDDVELAVSGAFWQELLAGMAACRARRAREPDYRRLTFVLLGAISRERFVRTASLDLEAIDAADFRIDEAYVLAAGFGGYREQARALMERVCVWTSGQPYLTQKVARGVARKGGKLEDVERVVREQLLGPGASQDPLLAHARAVLAARTPSARRALALVRRVARSGAAAAPADPAVREVLELSGVIVRDSAGALGYRNRVMREAFGARWIKSVAPAGWRIAAAAAAVVVLAALGTYAYFNYLPV